MACILAVRSKLFGPERACTRQARPEADAYPLTADSTKCSQESLKFTRHAKRSRLTTEDVSHALAAKNQEPLWGFAGSSQLPFRKTQTPSGNVYHIEDEEIDLSKMIKTEVPPVPREVSFTGELARVAPIRAAPSARINLESKGAPNAKLTALHRIGYSAHWLAIEGVQPLIKENPSQAGQRHPRNPFDSAQPNAFSPLRHASHVYNLTLTVLLTELAKFTSSSRAPQAGSTANGAAANSAVTPLVKHVLSRELQLYFARVTEAISADQPELREAALGSVRSDPGLHQLVPYLVAWGAEQVRHVIEREARPDTLD